MKNSSKRLLALFLVGVAMFSLFNFSSFSCVNATAESRGTVEVRQSGAWIGRYTVKFFDNSGNEISSSRTTRWAGFKESFNIPSNAEFVTVKTELDNLFYWVDVSEVKFKVNKDKVSLSDTISVVGRGISGTQYTEVKSSEGWIKI